MQDLTWNFYLGIQYLSEGLSLLLKLQDSLFRSFSCILEREDKLDLPPGSSFTFSFLRFFEVESSFFFVRNGIDGFLEERCHFSLETWSIEG